MEYRFLPAWGPNLLTKWLSRLGCTWTDVPPFNYSHALISYIYWKQPFTFPKGSYIFGDSGGFTLISGDFPIDPVDVMRWQMSMCSVGAILDQPPRLHRRKEWADCMAKTIRFVERALPIYLAARENGHPFRWWGVIHGYTDDEMKEWHKALSAVYPFTDDGEGWAVYPGPRARPMDVARTMHTLKDLKIKRAHLLACTGMPSISAILAFGPQCGMEFVSFDSANIVHAAINRWLWKPDGTPPYYSFTPNHNQGAETDLMAWLWECPCSVCNYVRAMYRADAKLRSEIDPMVFGAGWELWFGLHNLHTQLNAIDACAERAPTDADALLKEVLSKREYSATIKAFHGEHAEKIVARGTGQSLLDYLR